MGFGVNSWAKAWEFKPSDRYTDTRISTSKKDRQTDEYKQDFSGFVRLVGAAHTKAQTMKNGDRFKILSCSVENTYDKESRVTYYNFIVFDIESADDGDSTGRAHTNAAVVQNTAVSPAPAEEENEDELPF